MKQIFLILSIVPFLFGCVQTREQRGAEIAKSEMMKRLYDADSYEPIETHIDSGFRTSMPGPNPTTGITATARPSTTESSTSISPI